MNINHLSQLSLLFENWVFTLIMVIGASLIPFLTSSITPFTRLLAFISEARNRQILMARISQGSYDKETILQSTQFYISPKCSNIDPAQEEEVRQALMATRESLFEKIDYFIDQGSSKRHLLILADSGTGKTSFVLNYYAYNLRRRKRKASNLFLVYLGFKDADKRLREHENKNETIVLLDALDEDTKAITNHRMRIRELMDICRDYRRVIITCRTQFFPSDEEIPVETGVAYLGPRKAGEKGVYEFWKLYLSPFDDNDINMYLKRRFPLWQQSERNKARELAFQVKALSARPMLLAHITDVVKSNISIRQTYQLYQLMVNAWLERESTWVKMSDLKEYSELLSVNLYIFREHRGMERIPHDELANLAYDWGIDLSQWQLSGRSLLNRDAQGNYKFAHRSIMEFLFVNRVIQGDNNCSGIILSDQMKSFLIEQIVPESISSDLKFAIRLLSENEVCIKYIDSNSASCAEINSLDQATNSHGLVNHTSEDKTFLDILDYTACYIYDLSGRMPIELYSLKNRIYNDSLARRIKSIAENIGWGDSAYERDVIEMLLSLPDYKYTGTPRSKLLQNKLVFYNSRPNANFLSGEPNEMLNCPKPQRVHPSVKRFIELYGVLGLVSYHLINSSGFCSIRPKLPKLDQFDLLLVPTKC